MVRTRKNGSIDLGLFFFLLLLQTSHTYALDTHLQKKQIEEFFNTYKLDPISFVGGQFFFPNIDLN